MGHAGRRARCPTGAAICLAAAAVVAVAVLAAGLAPRPAGAQEGTYLELAAYNRRFNACPGEPENPRFDCGYNLAATVRVEVAPIEAAADWFAVFARQRVLAEKRDPGDLHVTPVAGDFGGGLVLRHYNWSLELFGSSQHCIGGECPFVEYNAVALRWTARD